MLCFASKIAFWEHNYIESGLAKSGYLYLLYSLLKLLKKQGLKSFPTERWGVKKIREYKALSEVSPYGYLHDSISRWLNNKKLFTSSYRFVNVNSYGADN